MRKELIAFLAFRDILKDRRIVLLVIFLMTFSFINLTFFPAFLNGLSNTFQEEVIDTVTAHILVEPSADSKDKIIDHEAAARKKIELIPGVQGVSSRIVMPAAISYKGRQAAVPLIGIDPERERDASKIYKRIIAGEFLGKDDNEFIMLGREVAGERLEDKIGKTVIGKEEEGLGGVRLGDIVKVKFQNGVEREYKVKAVLGREVFSSVAESAFIRSDELSSVLGVHDKASSILVRLEDMGKADDVKALVLGMGIPNVQVKTWSEASNFAVGIKQTFGTVIYITSLVGIVVVVSTIGIIVFINVTRKRRIIGVLKAIGMHSGDIMFLFLIQSLFFVIVGMILGTVLLHVLLYYFSQNPLLLPLGFLVPSIGFDSIFWAWVIMFVSAVFAGYIPASLAAREKIIETIKVVE
ncbi:MAG: ABC transporter permease [Candidatus Aenigmarchaeota archaeon]|nr:ABC transporter permease [Candidatus Aenigmarchaeota archaeon]